MNTPTKTTRYLRIAQTCTALGGIDRATLSRLRKRDDFPKARYVGAAPVFPEHEVTAWVESQTTPRALGSAV